MFFQNDSCVLKRRCVRKDVLIEDFKFVVFCLPYSCVLLLSFNDAMCVAFWVNVGVLFLKKNDFMDVGGHLEYSKLSLFTFAITCDTGAVLTCVCFVRIKEASVADLLFFCIFK